MTSIIPTRYKSALPQRLSFPIGAEILSEALLSVPHFDKLTVTFYYHPKANDFPKDSVEFSVVEIRFRNLKPNRNSSKQLLDEGYYDETWEIMVKPIPRELKSKIKQHLIAQGLPKIKEWLSIKRTATWLEGRRSLEFLYYKTDDVLKYRENGTP